MNVRKKLIILDRDGVINFESIDYIKSPEEWIPIPGSIEAIALLSKAKYSMVICTNQSGVSRGLFSLQMLERIHQKMLLLITQAGGKIERIYFCPHRPNENCACRKPKIKMFEDIQRDFNIPFSEMIYVGDSERDFEVAQKIGCQFFLVRTGNGEATLKKLSAKKNIVAFDDLLAVVMSLLNSDFQD